MIFENKNELKLWLLEKLPNLSDADPEYLSKYIVTLVTKSNSESKLKRTCKEALKIFLNENTDDFVNDLIKFIHTSGHIPVVSIKTEKVVDHRKSPINKNQSPYSSDDSEYWHNKSPNLHLSKRHRDSSNFREDSYRKKKKYNESEHGSRRRHYSGRQRYRRSRERIDNQRVNRHQFGPMNNKFQSSVKTSCTDFVKKGYCLKGDNCEFDHGSRIVLPDLKCIYSGVNMSQNNLTTTWMNLNSSVTEANENQTYPYLKTELNDCDSEKYNRNSSFYDPCHPNMNDGEFGDSSVSSDDNDPVYVPTVVKQSTKDVTGLWNEMNKPFDNNNGTGMNRANSSTTNNSNTSKFNSNKYQNNRRNSQNTSYNNKRFANSATNCLLVSSIPIEQNIETNLRRHFEQFGSVKDIIVAFQNDQHNSLIEFETAECAVVAYRSPKAIFNNRFIKTSFYYRNNSNVNNSFRRGSRQNNQFNGNNNYSRVFREAQERNIIDVNYEKEEEVYTKWNRKRKISVNSDDGMDSDHDESSKPIKTELLVNPTIPTNPNDFKLDRRPQVNVNEKKEDMKRIESSIDSQKERLKALMAQIKLEGEDKDLVSRQLNESYLYYQELQQIYDSILQKAGLDSTTRKIQLIKEKAEELKQYINQQNTDPNEKKELLKQMTALKREQIKLESDANKNPPTNPHKIPKLVEMKLDNRPKILYLSEFKVPMSSYTIKNLFKSYKISRFDESFNIGPNRFIGIHFVTRKECDKAISELSGILVEMKLKFSFERPLGDPEVFNFSVAQTKHRGSSVKNENCLSSDEDDIGMKSK